MKKRNAVQCFILIITALPVMKMTSLCLLCVLVQRTDPQLLAQFYYADEELNQVATELDGLDGRKDPQRCTLLVNQFRSCQVRLHSPRHIVLVLFFVLFLRGSTAWSISLTKATMKIFVDYLFSPDENEIKTEL